MFRFSAKLLAFSLPAAVGTVNGERQLDVRLGSNHAVEQSLRDCDSYCPEMAIVPQGRFTIGSPMNEAG